MSENQDSLINKIKTTLASASSSSSTMANAFRRCLQRDQYIRQCAKIDEIDEMSRAINWISERCQKGIEVVIVTPRTWGSVGFAEIIRQGYPLDYVFVGGLFWIERAKFHEWLKEVRVELGERISVVSVSPGPTDFYPTLIYKYELVNCDRL